MNGIELIDCHTHTYLSGHGLGSVDDLVQAARKAGIGTLTITEHAPLPNSIDPENGFSMSEQGVEVYLEDIENARKKYDDIKIQTGSEVDWRHGDLEFISRVVKPFDVLYGSVHMLNDGFCFDNRGEITGWDLRGVNRVWEEYFELWREAISSDIAFDVMSHPDLPKKFGHRPDFEMSEMYEEAAQCCADAGVMIEINTSGWRRPVSEQYPSLDFLKIFYAHGVDCTVGSDAHTPEEVGYRIKDAYQIMYEAGYRRVSVPLGKQSRRYIEFV
jgi:histidinol-phosphatase (PHP family)